MIQNGAYEPQNMKKRSVDLIVIHCSATRESQDYTEKDLLRDHRARGFSKIGYHRYIRKDGTVIVGRDFSEVGAHVEGHNAHSIGICYEGGLDDRSTAKKSLAKDTRTQAQKEAMIKLIKEAIEYSSFNVKRIVGHRDLSPDKNGNGVVEPNEWVKMCPCFEAIPEYKYLMSWESWT
jgi:N-acetylmuramoyl-L-alanine amidase